MAFYALLSALLSGSISQYKFIKNISKMKTSTLIITHNDGTIKRYVSVKYSECSKACDVAFVAFKEKKIADYDGGTGDYNKEQNEFMFKTYLPMSQVEVDINAL